MNAEYCYREVGVRGYVFLEELRMCQLGKIPVCQVMTKLHMVLEPVRVYICS